MPRIFISYRRDDSDAEAGRIFDRLSAHFGKANVFMDIDSIPIGADIKDHISQEVGRCDIILAIIGKGWLDAHHNGGADWGKRRLDEPTDFVRLEIAAGLERKIRIIPVLVGGASMPREEDLPNGLKPLVFRNAAEVRTAEFHAHMDRLISGIEGREKGGSELARREEEAPFSDSDGLGLVMELLAAVGLTAVSAPQVNAAMREIYPNGVRGVDPAVVMRAIAPRLQGGNTGASPMKALWELLRK